MLLLNTIIPLPYLPTCTVFDHKNYGSFLSRVGRGRYRGTGDKIRKLLSEIAISFDGHASTIFVTDFSFITILSLTCRLLHQ